MTRLKAINPAEATGKTKELFNAIESKLGMVPNMMRTMGNSSAVLEGYLNLSGALSNGTLNAKTGELIALAVAESNACNYCLAAHSYIGENLVKIDTDALEAARSGISTDAKTTAILSFALCGFANFSSIAIQVGGIGELVPERRADLAALGFRALICGTLASYLSATIVGILL